MTMKKGGKEERREGGKEGRKEGGKEGRKEGGKVERREGGKEGRREGGKEKRREGRKAGRQEGRKEGRKEIRRKGGKEGRKEGGKEGRTMCAVNTYHRLFAFISSSLISIATCAYVLLSCSFLVRIAGDPPTRFCFFISFPCYLLSCLLLISIVS